MKTVLCFWSFLLITIVATGQTLKEVPILETQQLKKGLYRTFEEFQTNNPSEQGDLIIKNRSLAAQTYLLAHPNELIFRDESGQEHKVKNFWGYCDGKNIYIHDNGLNRLDATGYYCLYTLHGMQPSRNYINQADMTVNSLSAPMVIHKVVNIVTGKILELSAYNLKKYILPQDNDLLVDFRTAKEKKELLENYICRFNQRNKPFLQ
ncbi:hypothetical protein ACDQ55_03685 [Chitinophaga sp. 30R24]|uniref:hypothetical protein n=1 Tax=Chitinophaga sp. 30R24 TaxID=3248838 RepID=UPI003B90AD90